MRLAKLRLFHPSKDLPPHITGLVQAAPFMQSIMFLCTWPTFSKRSSAARPYVAILALHSRCTCMCAELVCCWACMPCTCTTAQPVTPLQLLHPPRQTWSVYCVTLLPARRILSTRDNCARRQVRVHTAGGNGRAVFALWRNSGPQLGGTRMPARQGARRTRPRRSG
eukprot:353404-Chlamydomonas_euryale.AAC.19